MKKRKRWLKNVNVRVKIAGCMVIMLIECIGVGIAGLVGMNKMNQQLNEIVEDYAESVILTKSVGEELEKIQKYIYAHCIAGEGNKMDSYAEQIDKSIVAISGYIESYRVTLSGEAEIQQFEEFVNRYDQFQSVALDVLELSTNGQTNTAVAKANGQLRTNAELAESQLEAMAADNDSRMSQAKLTATQSFQTQKLQLVITGIVAVVINFICIVFLGIEVIHPLKYSQGVITDMVDEIGKKQGDLTKRIEVSGKDELGQLGKAINSFIETLQNVMGEINQNTVKMDEVVKEVAENVAKADTNSCDISAAMEELSAAMEEVSATATTVNGDAKDVGDNVSKLADFSEGLADYTKEMKGRAVELEKTAVQNKEDTSSMVEEILDSLRQAIEQSKSVDQVDNLTNEILSISSQTNLLALNASIEAARAGEAGKGFAVVADEIRQLADSSRETASNIQRINTMVTGAVHQLASNSDRIISYINESILPDYEGFVESGRKYREDSEHINQTVGEFQNMSEHLDEIVEHIVESIKGISAAIDQSANAISTTAVNTETLVSEIAQVNSSMATNNTIAARLKGEADRFTNL